VKSGLYCDGGVEWLEPVLRIEVLHASAASARTCDRAPAGVVAFERSAKPLHGPTFAAVNLDIVVHVLPLSTETLVIAFACFPFCENA
jgi:hypothetical protein